MSGTTLYRTENTNDIPSFVFYLYHSKNLQTAGTVGSVIISVEAVTPINDLQNQIQPQISLSSDEIENLRNHQNEFCLVFDNTTCEKSVLFLSDIDKNNFENNIKTKLLNNYWTIKIAHHGTFHHFTNKLPDSKYKIISNSFYKNTGWGITAEYPNNYASNFICTNNNNCKYYLDNGKCCPNSFKCGINHSFFEVIP